MTKIAICGGIGSGKSEVLKILLNQGFNTISVDEINKQLLKDTQYIILLKKHFPEAFQGECLDKALLKEIIFSNRDKRLLLNNLAHPRIKDYLKNKIDINKTTFVEVPLISEANMTKDFDCIWAVCASLDRRIKRIMQRDNIDKKLALRIINAQQKEDDYCKFAHRIINNDGSFDQLKDNVNLAIKELLKN